jgi:hypothetical protein
MSTKLGIFTLLTGKVTLNQLAAATRETIHIADPTPANIMAINKTESAITSKELHFTDTTGSILKSTKTVLGSTGSILESTQTFLSSTGSILESTQTLLGSTGSILESTQTLVDVFEEMEQEPEYVVGMYVNYICVPLVAGLGLVGNTLAFCVVVSALRSPRGQSTTYVYMAALAVADSGAQVILFLLFF